MSSVKRRLPLLVKNVLSVFIAATYISSVQAEGGKSESEAQRLENLREIVKGENVADFKKIFSKNVKGPEGLCNTMVTDLLEGRNFKAIEPVVVFEHEFPSGSSLGADYQARQQVIAESALGKEVADGIARCREADAEGSEDRARILFTGAANGEGLPPYRFYKLPKKINPVPTTNIVFWSEFDQQIGRGRSGYLWVNLQRCEYVKGIGAMTSADSLLADPFGQAVALVAYSNTGPSDQSLAVWKVSRGLRLELEVHSPLAEKSKVNSDSTINCVWDTYKSKEINHGN